MRIILFGCWLVASLMCCQPGISQITHQPDIRISLLTAAPGEELYSVFGHNAIRVRVDSLNYDIVYNYGVFNFNAPNFYINFARGRMLYHLDTASYNDFMAGYMYENRCVREQVLALDSAQTLFMVQFLENNNRPENRHYLYHFFLDNCATRIRDLMLQTFDGLQLPESHEMPSYRDLIHRYLSNHPWGRFGIDIALGLPTDQKTILHEQMFLPDYVFDVFAKASYQGRPTVWETHDVFTPDQPAIRPHGPFTPTVVCSALLALAILFLFVQKCAKAFDFMLFLAVGFAGLLVVFLWFFTDHTNTYNNLNIIWALPTHAIMAFFLLSARRSRFTRTYFLLTAILAMLLVISWIFLPQRLNLSLIPLVLAIALRAFRVFRTV